MSRPACDQQPRDNQHTSTRENYSVLTHAKENMMSSTIETESDILTIDQAAKYLSIPKATLYTWRTRRAGYGPPAVRFGSCLRYRRADLDAWVAEHLESLSEDSAPSAQEQGQSLSRASHPRLRRTP